MACDCLGCKSCALQMFKLTYLVKYLDCIPTNSQSPIQVPIRLEQSNFVDVCNATKPTNHNHITSRTTAALWKHVAEFYINISIISAISFHIVHIPCCGLTLFFPFYLYFYLVCNVLSLFNVIMFGAPELWW